jgi:hypothetical protein
VVERATLDENVARRLAVLEKDVQELREYKHDVVVPAMTRVELLMQHVGIRDMHWKP